MIAIPTRGAVIAVALAVTAGGDATGAKRSEINPCAISALESMGAFLRAQQSFSVKATTQTDYVLDNGQKVRLASDVDLQVQRPDRLHADVRSDRKQRQFFYDGNSFTIFSPRLGYYAIISAPSTILATADQLENTYGVELPLVDLFRWGTDESDVGAITAAMYVGTARIDGALTDHYAFRQRGVDWQIWIERGVRPLPRKLLLTTTDDRARPDYEVEMRWNLAARFDRRAFELVPPRGSTRIGIERLGSAPPTSIGIAPHRTFR